MKVREMIKLGELELSKAHCSDPKIDAEALYCFLTGADRIRVFLQAEEEVQESVARQYAALIEERAGRVPVQHIIGTQEFMGFPFNVGSDVLIPRQDTELLVEEAAKMIHGENPKIRSRKTWKVLDLCCGSGVIGISLAKICPTAKVTATDISVPAIEIAKKNADRNRTKIKLLQGDLFEPIGKKKYDLIVSNPPYIPTNMISVLQDEIKEHEPRIALDGGKDGLHFYRQILSKVPKYLTSHGVLLLEIGHNQNRAVKQMMQQTGTFSKVHIIKDLLGKDRVVYAETLY